MAGDPTNTPPLDALTERNRLILICVALAVITFATYWFLGPQETTYGFQVSQANNILHGHLDMTAEHTKNLGVLERVLYDGEGFCLPANDTRGHDQVENPRITANCKTYMQHSLGPAFIELPGVLIFGVDLNQTLVSVVFAAMTAPLVFLITRKFSDHLLTQLAMTALVMFGTVFWWVGSNGGVWFFAHTTAVFFVFATIYATVVARNPLLAGACAGAAFMCRPTELFVIMFPVVAFSDLWLQPSVEGEQNWKRIRLLPLFNIGTGMLPFILLTMLVNYLRFDSPFETGYNYAEQIHQTYLQGVYNHGLLDVRYIPRHVDTFWEQMPLMQKTGPYILPSLYGLAMWVTSPALFFSLSANLKQRPKWAIAGAFAIAAACVVIFTRAASQQLGWVEWWGDLNFNPDFDLPLVGELTLNPTLLPFWGMIGVALYMAVRMRDRLVLACWACILPIVLANWIFAAVGYAQFGYRYGLDFMPFLWLLTVVSVGKQAKWYHYALVLAAIVVNLWGVLWHYQFETRHSRGWTWVRY
jgi:hypothetical protein